MSFSSKAGVAVKPHYISIMFFVAMLVIAGQWKQGKGIRIQTVIGCFAVAIALSLIDEADEGLANGFSYLILAAAAFRYVPILTSKSKSSTSGSKTSPQVVTGAGRTAGSGHGSDAIGGGSVPAIDGLPPNLGKVAKGLDPNKLRNLKGFRF